MQAQTPPASPLLSAPISGLIRQIGVPVSVGAFFYTMYNVVDTFYAGLISEQALAALSLSFPIFFIIIAFGFGFSQGNTALMGNSLGREAQTEAQLYAVQGLGFGVVISVALTAFGLFVAPSLIGFLGATDPLYKQMTLDYINPIFAGAIFFVTLQMLTSILNTIGRTTPGRNFLIFGFFLNLILDPWFIFGGFGLPAMGITGIALATVLTQVLGCLYIGYEVAKTDLVTSSTLRAYWRPRLSAFGPIFRQGFPNALDFMGVSLGFLVLVFYTGQFGQAAVAALGAASRLEQVALLPLLGLNVAVISLVASNNGARQIDRVHETFNASLRYGSLIMLITTILVFVLARPLMSIFTDDPIIIAIGISYVRIRSLGLIPGAIFFMSSSAMRGVKRPLPPLILNMFRFVFLPWLLIIILVENLGYGLDAIWLASTASFVITAVAAWLIARRILPQKETAPTG